MDKTIYTIKDTNQDSDEVILAVINIGGKRFMVIPQECGSFTLEKPIKVGNGYLVEFSDKIPF